MLQKISLRFDPVEDRLVLRLTVKTPAGPVDHWLLLTRRLCVGWRRDLQAMVDMSAALPERMDRAAKAAVSSAHHQALASQVPTRTEAAEPVAEQPAERPPMLVTKIECGRRRGDGRWVLNFELRDGPPLAMVVADPTLHALVDAVSRRVAAAGWNLPPIASERAPVNPHPAAPLH